MEEPAEAPVDVSVVIIVRNGAATIRRQLNALAAQVDAPPFEVVVSNNGSTDATVDVVRQWERDGIGAAERLVIADASAKPGIPYARNVGAQAASGRLILWCDADDAVRPGWVKAFADHVASGGAGGLILAHRPDGTPDHGAFPPRLTPTNYLPHGGNCNMAVVREDFFKVGGYDESLPPYGCEDVDLSWRLQEAGLPMDFVPEAVVDFAITPRAKVLRKTFRAAKARIAVALRHPESLSGQRLTIGTCLTDVAHNTVMLPWRLARPGGTPRTRILRALVASYGRLAGYWTYGIRKKPAQYINQETP